MSVVEAPSAPVVSSPTGGGADAAVAAPATSARRALALDVGLLGAASVVALTGFHPAFGGVGYLVAGVSGLVAGMLLAGAALRFHLRWPWVVGLTLLVYLLLGSVLVVPERALGGIGPSPESVVSLLDGSIRGWVNLVTTVPPVGGAQNLYAIPLLCGLVCGLVSLSIARRATRFVAAALLPPLGVLIAGVLMGTSDASWLLQATAFALCALLWGAARQRSARTAGLSSQRSTRWLGSVAVLGVAGALGLLIGTSSVVVDPDDRFVLRDHVDPPVELRRFPSPLEGFRSYLDEARAGDVILRVDGLEPGDRLRLATLDSYDGVVWHVLDDAAVAPEAGVFERVGEDLPVTLEGSSRRLEIEVVDYEGPWVPTLYGELGSISFGGDRAGALADGFRYNLVTSTAAEPTGLRSGDAYSITAVAMPDRRDVAEGEPDPVVVVPDPVTSAGAGSTFAALLSEQADSLAGEAPTPLGRVRAVEAAFAEPGGTWYFSDGQDPPERAGHSIERLSDLLDGDGAAVGNDEQYAAAMALLADQLGMPARVVVGFAPDVAEGEMAEVTGSDIAAWVEVAVDGHGWVPLFPTPPEDQRPKPADTQPLPPPDQFVPPPPSPTTTVVDATGAGEAGTSECQGDDCERETSTPTEVPVWVKLAGLVVGVPLLLFGSVTGALGGAKSRRRHRRRTSGPPSARIAAGWDEVCDLARDLGDVTPQRSTRRETAVIVDRPGIADLARRADTLVFGPVAIDEPAIEHYWQDVQTTRASMLGPLGRVDRWKALVNPTSLRRGRGARR